MINSLLVFTIAGLSAIFSHRKKKIDEKTWKRIPISDWITVFAFPVIFYITWAAVVEGILDRERIEILPFSDFAIIATMIPFLSIGGLGNGIHFTSKVLWRYLDKKKELVIIAHQINEMFHDKMSHYLVFLGGLMVMFLVPLLEINHPFDHELKSYEYGYIFTVALLAGYFIKKAFWFVNDWFGGYNRPLFIFILILLGIHLIIFWLTDVNIQLFPITLFVAITFLTIEVEFLIGKALSIFKNKNVKYFNGQINRIEKFSKKLGI